MSKIQIQNWKEYKIEDRLRTETERALYLQAVSIETDGDPEAMEKALIVIERSRALHK